MKDPAPGCEQGQDVYRTHSITPGSDGTALRKNNVALRSIEIETATDHDESWHGLAELPV